MRLHDYFDYRAREQADEEFAVEGDRTITYREAAVQVNKLANALVSAGLQVGDRIAVLSKNSIEYAVLYYACSKAGIAPVPLNYRLPARSTGPTTDGCCAARAAVPGFARQLARSFKSAVSTRQPSAPSRRAREWARVRSTAMYSRSTNSSCSNSPIYKKKPGSTFVATTPEPLRHANASKDFSRANTNSSRGIRTSP